MTGRNNRVFADSNILCFHRLKELAPGNRHELLILDGYGHQDPFMGARVADEVFPQFLPFLRRPAAAWQAARAAPDRKSTRLNSSHYCAPRMPSSPCTNQN